VSGGLMILNNLLGEINWLCKLWSDVLDSR